MGLTPISKEENKRPGPREKFLNLLWGNVPWGLLHHHPSLSRWPRNKNNLMPDFGDLWRKSMKEGEWSEFRQARQQWSWLLAMIWPISNVWGFHCRLSQRSNVFSFFYSATAPSLPRAHHPQQTNPSIMNKLCDLRGGFQLHLQRMLMWWCKLP